MSSDDKCGFDDIYRAVVEHTNDVVFAVDETLELTFVNQRLEDLFGVKRSDLLGVPITTIVRQFTAEGGAKQEFCKLVDAVARGECADVEMELPIETAQLGEAVLAVRLTHIGPDADIAGAVGFAREITEQKQDQQQLEEERQKYRTLVEHSQEGITIVQDGVYVFANQRMAEIAERDRTSLCGMPFEKFIAPEYRDVVRRRHEQRINGENPPSAYDIEALTPDGRTKHIELQASRVNYEGEPAVLATFRDVTDRREWERELRRLENAVAHAGHAIFITDVDGTIEYVNEAFETITGYTAEEALGETPGLVSSEEHDEAFFADLWETILDGNIWTGDLVNERANGERYIAQQTIAPIQGPAGELQGFVSIQDDVTDRQLRKQQLDVFHRIFRHNLRNELNIVQGYTEALLEVVDDDDHVEWLETILASVQSLDEISGKAQYIRKSLVRETCEEEDRNLRTLIERSTKRLASSYPASEFQLNFEPAGPIEVDDRVTIALRELIENAVEHSDDDNPHVTITVSAADSTVMVAIADNGPGIPDQERRALESGSEEPLRHGSGLGLWIAHWLIHYVGGTIQIDDTSQGTTVTASMPFR